MDLFKTIRNHAFPRNPSHPPLLAIAALSLGGMLGLALIIIGLGGMNTPVTGASFFSTATPFLPLHPTTTPFLPNENVPVTIVIEPTINYPFFADMDLNTGKSVVELLIQPGDKGFNNGNPVSTRFFTGEACDFGDQKACTSLHENGRYLLFTIHSGVGGEAQALRHAIEGTGINRAGKSLQETLTIIEAMKGSRVVISQTDFQQTDLMIHTVVRIPASDVAEYFTQPFIDVIRQAAEQNSDLRTLLESEEPAVFIETCGWRMAEEHWVPEINDTTGSIYLIAISATQ